MNKQIDNRVSSRITKNERLRQAVQGFRLVKLDCIDTDIALITGVTRGTVNNKKEIVDDLWDKESNTPEEDKKYILEKGIESGISKVSKKVKPTSEHVYGVILGMYLKVETNLLDEVDSLKRVWTIGENIAKIHSIVCRYKDKGTPIHSVENPCAKYLLDIRNMNKDSLDKLFIRSDSYKVDVYSKEWSSTTLLNKYIEVCSDKLLNIPTTLFPHMLREKCTISTSTQNNTGNTINHSGNSNKASDTKEPSYKMDLNYLTIWLVAKKSIVKQFKPNSKFMLLTQAFKHTDDEIYVSMKHKAKGSEYLGRTYNVFCSIHSHERRMLGYYAYDMSAAMQSICLQLIKAKEEDYPMLWNYTKDKAYKKRIRLEIAQALNHVDDNGNVDDTKVKKKLTAFANGSRTGIKLHSYYTAFEKESVRLRKAVFKHVALTEPEVLERARKQSRKAKALPKEQDWLDIDSMETPEEARAKSSVFFFVWTWYERKVRQAMLELFEDGIEVHDAVYSKEDISVETVQDTILRFSGFAIGIEQEPPIECV